MKFSWKLIFTFSILFYRFQIMSGNDQTKVQSSNLVTLTPGSNLPLNLSRTALSSNICKKSFPVKKTSLSNSVNKQKIPSNSLQQNQSSQLRAPQVRMTKNPVSSNGADHKHDDTQLLGLAAATAADTVVESKPVDRRRKRRTIFWIKSTTTTKTNKKTTKRISI